MSMTCITKRKKGNPEFYREYVSEDSLNQRPILLRRHRLLTALGVAGGVSNYL